MKNLIIAATALMFTAFASCTKCDDLPRPAAASSDREISRNLHTAKIDGATPVSDRPVHQADTLKIIYPKE